MTDEGAFWRVEAQQPHHETEPPILLPRLGAHISHWGHGHSCDSGTPHDGGCVCECGVPQGYDEIPGDAG